MSAPLIFDPAALRKIVDETIPAQLPAGHTSALVGTVDTNGVQVVLSVKKDAGSGILELDGVWKRTWTGQQSVGARLLYSF